MPGTTSLMPRLPDEGLPGPLHVSDGVLIAVQDEATGGANVGARAQAFRHARPTAGTVLAGIGRWQGDAPTPGARCPSIADDSEPPQSMSAMGLARWWLRTRLVTYKSS